MPSNQTTNYQLSQWAKSDQVKMEDFNADNAKIDGALASQAAALAGLTAAAAGYGNCQIHIACYTGSGTYGENSPVRQTFPDSPKFLIVLSEDGVFVFFARTAPVSAYPGGYGYEAVRSVWSGNTVSWYSSNAKSQMNASGTSYTVVALCSKD